MIFVRLLSVNIKNCDDLRREFSYEILNWYYLCEFLTSGNSIRLRRNFAWSRISAEFGKNRILAGARLWCNPSQNPWHFRVFQTSDHPKFDCYVTPDLKQCIFVRFPIWRERTSRHRLVCTSQTREHWHSHRGSLAPCTGVCQTSSCQLQRSTRQCLIDCETSQAWRPAVVRAAARPDLGRQYNNDRLTWPGCFLTWRHGEQLPAYPIIHTHTHFNRPALLPTFVICNITHIP